MPTVSGSPWAWLRNCCSSGAPETPPSRFPVGSRSCHCLPMIMCGRWRASVFAAEWWSERTAMPTSKYEHQEFRHRGVLYYGFKEEIRMKKVQTYDFITKKRSTI